MIGKGDLKGKRSVFLEWLKSVLRKSEMRFMQWEYIALYEGKEAECEEYGGMRGPGACICKQSEYDRSAYDGMIIVCVAMWCKCIYSRCVEVTL